MKLHIAFDTIKLDQALQLASDVADDADILEVGTMLIAQYGVSAVQEFRKAFPEATIFADTKIVNFPKEMVELYQDLDVDWISVMSGVPSSVIHATTTAAHQAHMKVVLDLSDSGSIGQSALEAENLGANALLFHQPYTANDAFLFLDKWDMVKGNSNLPIFMSAKVNRDNIEKIIALNPDVIVISSSQLVDANNQLQLSYFTELINKKR